MLYNTKGIFKDNKQLWVEKYRPKDLSEYIGDPSFKEKVKNFFDNQEVSNLLLEGPAGTGKSSLANLVVKYMDCDFKYINASNESGIETVRTKIWDFCTSSSLAPIKILVLDEFSEFTAAGQNALRSIIEQYSNSTRFILTCNTVERIISPIRSRCQEFKVIPPTKLQVKNRCEIILKAEEVDYEEDELDRIVNSTYPDIRKSINSLQQNTITDSKGKQTLKLSKEFFKLLTYQTKVVEILQSTNGKNLYEKVNEIRQLIADSRVKAYNELYRYLYDNIDEYKRKDENIIPIILTLADGQLTDGQVVDKEINVVSVMIKLAELLTK